MSDAYIDTRTTNTDIHLNIDYNGRHPRALN